MVLERVVSQPIQKKPRPGCVFGELLGTSAEVLVQLLVDLFLQGAPEGPHHEPQPHLHLHKVVADGQFAPNARAPNHQRVAFPMGFHSVLRT